MRSYGGGRNFLSRVRRAAVAPCGRSMCLAPYGLLEPSAQPRQRAFDRAFRNPARLFASDQT